MSVNTGLPLVIGYRARENICIFTVYVSFCPQSTMFKASSCVFGGSEELRISEVFSALSAIRIFIGGQCILITLRFFLFFSVNTQNY